MARHGKGKLFSSHGRGAKKPLAKRLIIAGAAVLILLIALLIAGYYQLMAYLQGDSFRQSLADQARQALRAEQLEILSNLSIKSSRVAVDGIQLAKAGGIEQARASRISADINRTALLSRKLHLRKLSMEEASITCHSGTSGAAPATQSEPATRKSKAARPSKAEASAVALAPISKNPIQLDLFECKDTDAHLIHHGRMFQLLGANISATPAPRIGTGAWQINAENARFHTPFTYLRDSSIKSATVVCHGSNLDLTECRIMLTPGEMRTKAHYDLKRQRWTADLQVNKGDVRRILNEDWKRRLSGELYGRMVLTGSNSGVATASGNLSLQNGILEGLPFLSQIPVGNTYPYRSVELDKGECQILYPYNSAQLENAWLFDKISLGAKGGLLLVHGHIIVGEGGRLGGTLTIGVPEHIIESMPISQSELSEKLFTADGEEEGYMWVNMNLSGTVDSPKEDLSIRIATLIGANLGDIAVKGTASMLLNTLLKNTSPARPAESADEEVDLEDDSDNDSPAPAPSPIREATDAAGSLLRSLF